MKKINDDDLKKIQLDILDKVDKYCNENNLTYYLAGGTLIGAIRHKGYIPWDDDIDIFLKRKDYDFFIENFNCNNYLKVISIETNSRYYLTFAKVINTNTILEEETNSKFQLGVNIDVFPLDEINKSQFDLFYKRQKRYIQMLTLKNLSFKNRGIIKNIINFCGKIILFPYSKKQLIEKIIKNAKSNYGKNCDCIGNLVSLVYGKGDLWNKEYFDNTIIMKFEDREYKCPKEYDKILTNTYGNYMKFPPIEQQTTHHSFEAWWKEEN